MMATKRDWSFIGLNVPRRLGLKIVVLGSGGHTGENDVVAERKVNRNVSETDWMTFKYGIYSI
jgi:hypothetical protein